MACPHVRGDNLRALAIIFHTGGYYGITILYHLHRCRQFQVLFQTKVVIYRMTHPPHRHLRKSAEMEMSWTCHFRVVTPLDNTDR